MVNVSYGKINDFPFHYKVSREIKNWYDTLYSSIFRSENISRKRIKPTISESDSEDKITDHKQRRIND